MAMCIAVGKDAKAAGFACISIGDDVVTRGAFQIKVGEKITLPSIEVDNLQAIILNLQDSCLTFKAMSEQNYGPPDFGEKAAAAIQVVIDIFQKKLLEIPASVPASVISTGSVAEKAIKKTSGRRKKNEKKSEK